MARLRHPARLVLTFSLAMGALGGCRREYRVGDHVLVERKGAEYAGVIVSVEGPAKFRVHYDGYSEEWDETVPGTRIHGRLTAPVPTAAIAKRGAPGVSASASASAPPSFYRVGDRVRVEWHGATYTASIVAVLGAERYRVHYEGYGSEWDENIGLARIQHH
jgi:hypothetical protein